MELQTAFYIIGIVFMGLTLVMFLALLSAVLVIKAKLDRLHSMIDKRVNQAQKVASNVYYGFNLIKRLFKV